MSIWCYDNKLDSHIVKGSLNSAGRLGSFGLQPTEETAITLPVHRVSAVKGGASYKLTALVVASSHVLQLSIIHA